MEERREISRVEYKTNGVVVICDTQEKIYVDVNITEKTNNKTHIYGSEE